MTAFASHYLPLIAYAAAILIVSSIPRLATPDMGVTFLDKILHGLEYLILTVLTFRVVFAKTTIEQRRVRIVLSVAACLIFAAVDEYHQSFIPGRFAEVSDFVADAAGIGLGSLAYCGFRRFRKSLRP